MSVSVSSSATVTLAPAPHITGAVLTTILATPLENLTVANFHLLQDASVRIPHGDQTETLGTLFRTTPGGVSVSGSKTVTHGVSPSHTAAALTTLMATAIESLTLNNLEVLSSCLHRVSGAGDGAKTLGSLFV